MLLPGLVFQFNACLSQIVASAEERRNVSQLYRRLSLRELREGVPGIDWPRYLTVVLDRSIGDEEPVVVFALRYLNDLVVLLNKTPRR